VRIEFEDVAQGARSSCACGQKSARFRYRQAIAGWEGLRMDLRRWLEESSGALVVLPGPDSERREQRFHIELASRGATWSVTPSIAADTTADHGPSAVIITLRESTCCSRPSRSDEPPTATGRGLVRTVDVSSR